jgi:tetratricopeptide (TPR) repeat protein
VIQENLRNTRNVVKRLAEMDRLRREERRKKKEVRSKLDSILDNLAEDFGSAGAGADLTTGSDALGFTGSSEPLFSKGSKSSAPVDLRFANPGETLTVRPEDVKGTSKEDQVHKLTGDALMEMSLHHYSGAIRDLEAAVRLKPHDRELRILLGEALYQRDKRSGRRVSPKADILLDAVEHGKGDWNSSIRYLEDALSKEKNEKKAQVIRDVRNHMEALKVMDEKQHSAQPKTNDEKFDSAFYKRLYEVYGEKIGILLDKGHYKAALYIATFATVENPDSEIAREIYYRVFFIYLGSLIGAAKESQ